MHRASTGVMFLRVCHASLKEPRGSLLFTCSPWASLWGFLGLSWALLVVFSRFFECHFSDSYCVFQKYARRLIGSHVFEGVSCILKGAPRISFFHSSPWASLWGSLGLSWALLGLSWGSLGLSWGSLGSLGALLGSLGALLGSLGALCSTSSSSSSSSPSSSSSQMPITKLPWRPSFFQGPAECAERLNKQIERKSLQISRKQDGPPRNIRMPLGALKGP